MRGRFARGLWRNTISAGILVVSIAGCGASQSSSPPTATPVARRHVGPQADRRALQVAGAFLRAFKTDDRRTMLRLMSGPMRERNRHEYVQHMFGVQGSPARIDIVRAHTFRGRHGWWTRVVARLQFDHGTSTDAVAVVRTKAGYRIASVRALKRPSAA